MPGTHAVEPFFAFATAASTNAPAVAVLAAALGVKAFALLQLAEAPPPGA